MRDAASRQEDRVREKARDFRSTRGSAARQCYRIVRFRRRKKIGSFARSCREGEGMRVREDEREMRGRPGGEREWDRMKATETG